jgi:cytochrome b561
MVVRLGWRIFHPPPPLPVATPGWQRRAAMLSHRLLYVALLLQPVSGYLMSSFGEYGIKLFGVPLPVAGWPDPVVRQWLADAHRTLAVVLISLVVLHVIGAAVHGLLLRDGVVRRMLPRRAGFEPRTGSNHQPRA